MRLDNDMYNDDLETFCLDCGNDVEEWGEDLCYACQEERYEAYDLRREIMDAQ